MQNLNVVVRHPSLQKKEFYEIKLQYGIVIIFKIPLNLIIFIFKMNIKIIYNNNIYLIYNPSESLD